MKLYGNVLKTALVAAFMMSSPAHAGFEFLQPTKLLEKLQKQIAKQNIGTKLDIVDTEIYQGINIGLKYQLESEPSYVKGYYTRIDKYKLTGDVSPGDILEDNDSSIGFNIKQDAEIVFARQFKGQRDSLVARPYTLKNIPLTAQKARENLNVGDFVAMEGKLNLILSVGTSEVLSGGMDFGVSTHVYLSGEFLIHIFKMSDNKVRVKLIATRGKGAGFGANIATDDLEYFGFRLIDKRIDSWLNIKPLKASSGAGKNELFMVDYVFDLDNPQAAEAYENIMSRKARFKDMVVINPLNSPKDLKNKILTDMSEIEKISWEDRNLDPKHRRIDRVFKGSNSSTGKSSSVRVGLIFAKFEEDTNYSQNKVIYSDRNNVESNYILDNFTQERETKLFWGMFGDKVTTSTNMLFTSNEQWDPVRFIALTLSRDIKMRNVSENDYERVQEHVASIIPASEYAKIDWKKWNFSKENLVNGYFKNEIVFHPAALAAFPSLTPQQLGDLFKAYVDKHGRPLAYRNVAPARGKAPEVDYDKKLNDDIKTVAKQMAMAFNAKNPVQTRYDAFRELKDFSLWQERGTGFLLSLLPKSQLTSLISYNMVFSAKGVETITHKFGNFNEEELYKSLIYIQKVVTDRSFDLRLYTNENGEFTTRNGEQLH